MLIKSITAQAKIMLHRKSTLLLFYSLLALVLANFIHNVLTYRGWDVLDMYYPMKLLLLGDNSGIYGYALMLFYPLLVVIPAGFSYIRDKETGSMIFLVSRTGKGNYILGKLTACFFVTFLIFTIPFLIEMGLNMLSFPMECTGDPSNFDIYSEAYMGQVSRYFWKDLFLSAPGVYTVVCTLLFGAVSATLAVFVAALSTLLRIKFKVLLLLPVYFILNLFGMLDMIFPGIKVSVSYFAYLTIFDTAPKSMAAYFILLGTLMCISLLLFYRAYKKDLLL